MSVEAPVPAQFQCPISLELMMDPVTLSTGQTYDRGSIQRWFRAGKKTCPTTRQELQSSELIPNLALQNCIRGWQDTTGGAGHIVSTNAAAQARVPTSPRLLSERHVKRMLDDVKAGPDRVETLRQLRTVTKGSERNRKMVMEGGALSLLGSILLSHRPACDRFVASHQKFLETDACEEALGLMAVLCTDDEAKQAVGQAVGLKNLPTLSYFLRKGSMETKMSALVALECLVSDDDSLLDVAAEDGLLPGVVAALRTDSYLGPRAVTDGLRALYAICLPRNNRPKVVEAGAVGVVLELLPGAKRQTTEGAMAILNLLSRCSQGREALCEHALSIPLLVKVIISQSKTITEHAVKALHSMLMFTANPSLNALAVKHGVVRQLLMVIQCGGETGTKHRAQDILKFLQVACDGDPCLNTINYSR